jgi:hypothetical protein
LSHVLSSTAIKLTDSSSNPWRQDRSSAQPAEGESTLQPGHTTGQRCSEAVMDAEAEGEVAAGVSVALEAVWVGKSAGVSVGRVEK